MPRTTAALAFETMGDVLVQLGDIDPRRVRLQPPPGRATERDLIRLQRRSGRLFELVDGTLVEKILGFPESALALRIGRLIGNFAEDNDRGIVAGADGAMRLMPGLVRIPDISFIAWERLPTREVPDEPIARLAPDLAVEVLSEGNTPAEMERKLREYFLAGVRVVWFVDRRKRTVTVHTVPDRCVVYTEDQTLDGGDVLPGLVLPVRDVFAQMPRSPRSRHGAKVLPGAARAKEVTSLETLTGRLNTETGFAFRDRRPSVRGWGAFAKRKA